MKRKEKPRNQDADECWYGSDGGIHLFYWTGELLIYRELGPPLFAPPIGKRGNVKAFSDESRFRMLKYVATLDWDAIGECHFLTLTYPDDKKPESKDDFNSAREKFAERFERRTSSKLACLWRIEWKRRKTGWRKGQYMPHFHMLTFGNSRYKKKDVWDCWEGAIGEMIYADVDCERMESKKQAGIYCAKYAGKVTPLLGNDAYHREIIEGRQWGKLRKNLIPLMETRVLRLPDCDVVDMSKDIALANRPEVNIYGNESFTLLGKKATEIGEFIFDNPVDGQPEGMYTE